MVDESPEGFDDGGLRADETLDTADELAETRHAVVGEDNHGARLDKAVVALAPEFSRTYLQALIRAGHARIDGTVETSPARRLRLGQRLAVVLEPTAESQAYRPESLPLAIVYEDEHLAVVDKSAGMVVHPAAGNWSGTLLNALLGRDPRAAALPRAGIVHRLDKDTSGLMVVGRTQVAVTALSRAIAARTVHRRYLAIAQGRPPQPAFSVEAAIGRDMKTRTRMAVAAGGKPARTDFEAVAQAGGYTGLRCTLHTGRTHQIRVHLASVGLPIVADRVYGGTPSLGMERQALHAAELAFAHPADGRPMAFTAALPADMTAAWKQLAG